MATAIVQAAGAAAVRAEGVVGIPLRKPVKFEDVERSELVLDLGGLSGRDIAAIVKEAEAENGYRPIAMPALDPHVQALAAAKAAGVPAGLVMQLDARDFLKVTEAVRDFLANLQG
jgi:hypothetical protein